MQPRAPDRYRTLHTLIPPVLPRAELSRRIRCRKKCPRGYKVCYAYTAAAVAAVYAVAAGVVPDVTHDTADHYRAYISSIH